MNMWNKEISVAKVGEIVSSLNCQEISNVWLHFIHDFLLIISFSRIFAFIVLY